MEYAPVLELNGSLVKFCSEIKVLGVLIDSNLCFQEQFKKATNKAHQTLSFLKRRYLNVTNFKPYTMKKLCQSIVIPQWTYLAFLWGDQIKFQNSPLWSEILALITCSSWNPPRGLLEILSDLVPIDLQLQSHAAKFCIKALQQPENDPVRSLLQSNETPIARKLNSDRRLLGQLDTYEPATMSSEIRKRWNIRLQTNPITMMDIQVDDVHIFPKRLTKS